MRGCQQFGAKHYSTLHTSRRWVRGYLFALVFISFAANAQSVLLLKKNAEVWGARQRISGKVATRSETISVRFNDSVFVVPVVDLSFAFDVVLDRSINEILVEQVVDNDTARSDTVKLSLAYTPMPLVTPYAVADGDAVRLHVKTLENPLQAPYRIAWFADSLNPTPVKIEVHADSSVTAAIPPGDGEYFFNVLLTSRGDSAWFQTCVTRIGRRLVPFNIETDRSAWIDTAMSYQITPHTFINGGSFDGITGKLAELKTLGINTIYLQPVYKTFKGGQGYDVIDYFALRPELGSEAQLRALIGRAKDLGLRVLFDFVPNHTSINHPYAESIKKHGAASPYFDYYQHEVDGVTYSSHYHKDRDGFIYYFWQDLVNLNYNNEEVQRWMIEACKYWIRIYDIDGYRFDAVWGVNARMPSFGKRLRYELKSVKPDVFLLAEDKPGAEVYSSGFDAAYDWTMDTSWVSQWSWAYEYHEKESRTIFNFPDVARRAGMLSDAIFNHRGTQQPVLRFMENNDLPRFGVHHTPAQIRMAAALLFSLPGLPMLYNGQEVGVKAHPYTRHSVFNLSNSIRSADPSLFDYYRRLIALRKTYRALLEGSIKELSLSGSRAVMAFQRSEGDQHIIVITNLDSLDTEARVEIAQIFPSRPRRLRDLITGEKTQFPNAGNSIRLPVKAFTTRWMLIEL